MPYRLLMKSCSASPRWWCLVFAVTQGSPSRKGLFCFLLRTSRGLSFGEINTFKWEQNGGHSADSTPTPPSQQAGEAERRCWASQPLAEASMLSPWHSGCRVALCSTCHRLQQWQLVTTPRGRACCPRVPHPWSEGMTQACVCQELKTN